MTENLDSKIEERKKQARKRHIREKTELVADTFGTFSSRNDGSSRQWAHYNGRNLEIETSNFTIHVGNEDAGGYGATVIYRGETVYSEGGGTIYSYIPGAWEKILTKLYNQAKHIAEKSSRDTEAEKREIQRAKEREVENRWGL